MNTNNEFIKVEEKKHIIDDLTDYMFNSKLLRDTLRGLDKETIVREISPYKHKYHRNIFVPQQGDTLFWIFYILTKGLDTYELLGQNTFIAEKNEKITCIEAIKNCKPKLKEHRIKKHSTSENELLNEENISLKTFHMLCVCYNINFLYLKNRMYYLHDMDDQDDISQYKKIPVIHDMGDGIFGCEFQTQEEVFKNYLDTRMKIENYEKPFKSVTSYTIAQLKELCEVLKIQTHMENGKAKTKSIMYSELTLYLCGYE